MIHQESAPSPALSPYVEKYLYVECSAFESQFYPAIDKLLPDGTATLILNLGSPHRHYDPNNLSRWTESRRCWLTGPQAQPMVIGPTSGTQVLCVRFRAHGLAPFLRPPASDVSNLVLEMDCLWGRWGERTCDRLADAPDSATRLSTLEAALLDRLRRGKSADSRVTGAIRAIERNPSLAVGDLGEIIGVTGRHLSRLFHSHVGLSPKTLARLRRFRRVTHLVGGLNRVDWAPLAASEGYFDQSHLIANFRDFSGLSPESYLKKRTPFDGFVAV